MSSEVYISNLSLASVGANLITSLTDGNAEANVCKTHYPLARDATLMSFPWPEAVTRASLAKLASVPAFGFGSAFQLPVDCLRVIATDDDRTSWKVESGQLLCSADAVSIRYIKRNADPTTYSPALIACIAARLSAEIAIVLTGSRSLYEDLWKVSEAKLDAARGSAGGQGSADVLVSDGLLVVR